MTLLIVALLALLIGGGIGWFAGSRPIAEWKERHGAAEARAAEADAKYLRAFADLEAAGARAERLEPLERELRETRAAHDTTLANLRGSHEKALADLRTGHDTLAETLRGEKAALARELDTLKSGAAAREKALEDRYAEREQHFERELKRLVEAEEKLQAKFNEIGEKMLEGAQSRFMEGAQSHLANLNKESLAELEKKVGPVGETLERYRKRIDEIEKNRAEAYHQLTGVIGEVKAGQREVIDGANRITTTLKGATKARGDWGELQLENLLESCGLSQRTDFRREVGIKGEDGQDLRPDAIINIPGGRKLIVDVKNVFNTYKEANEAETEEQRGVLLAKHARELRGHVQALSAKRYQDHVKGSADFVVMFVPGEHVLYAALTQDEGLLDYALRQNVVLSSPLNFMSIAMTVATVWRQAGVQADADEIAKLGKELYDRLGVVARHLGNLRRDLGKANKSFDSLVGSFDTNLRRTGERFEELSIDTSAKELTEALPIGHQPRRLANFPDGTDNDE
ncbi:DNA recombination protein RmuC [Alteriqipengyuania flavescens]|uniref:DNA recombination protein RmuC n=1 Tax=Alteriqipengyuania flavescens TaxID=3053610 RepID=UPI0025B5D214|nr:DNA recombination protein RmuC [Alteriqipengyuania flavescens]WJY18878.1 DNA recombination protein RmuC [Alteriqipengyuania flavescens]WJY24818.1 DNA recombination protein RmuC [Alteriqipengyuania flavescens]